MNNDLRSGTVGINRLLLAAVMVLGVAARAMIHFSTPLAPRINGTYYWVQVRSLLESGRLAIPDLPLLFWIQAAMAFAIQHLTGMEREPAIIAACKLVDCAGPVLLALPVYFLLGRWRISPVSLGVAAAALTLAVLHPPLLLMTSQYEKNALGLVWFAAFAVSLRHVVLVPSRRASTLVLLFLILSGLTHIGAFGATLLFAGLAFMGGVVFLPERRTSLLKLALACGCAAAVVLWITAHGFDPQRADRLMHAVLAGGETAAPAPPAAATPATGPAHGTTSLAPLLFLGLEPLLLVHGMAIAALLIVWRNRRPLPRGESVFIASAALSALILGWPFAISERAVRLQGIAVAALVLLAPFVLVHARRQRRGQIVAVSILVLTLASLSFTLRWKTEPVIPGDSYAELQSLRTHIADPARTLIIARHGLEWWVVWTLRTKIAHANAVRADDWDKYAVVAVLTQKRGHGIPRKALPRDESQGVFDEWVVPPDAEILADGATFTLSRLNRPPPGLPSH